MHSPQIVINDSEIRVILKRIAFQIAENNLNRGDLLIIGLNDRGYFLAQEVRKQLIQIIPDTKIQLFQLLMVDLNHVEIPSARKIIIIDDVINSGKTAFMAAAACLSENVEQIETVFLAVREHRQFPVFANYIGISLATTLQEHVFFNNAESLSVYLQ
jgi:pyrimidine operon attenuation protein/uracil phosphoribosyltransferase